MRRQIPFHRSYTGKEEIKNVTEVLRSGWHTMGPKTREFEERFRAYTGARFAVSVNSCTAALHLALEAVGLKAGDEVLVPAVTFTASAEVVCYFGAKPVLVDVRRDTMTIDPLKIEEKITARTRAIIPVDFAGQPADYNLINKIAKRHKLFVIEDAAHTLPSSYKGKKVGTLADITCFSFYATKTLDTGEGGMITTQNKRWAARMKLMRLHGMSKDAWKRHSKRGSPLYDVVAAGFKYNTTDLNAAMGLAQLGRLERAWKKRAAVAKAYGKAFAGLAGVVTPMVRPDCRTSWHLYVLKLNLERLKIGRDRFIVELARRGVAASVHFIPLYRHSFYKEKFGYQRRDFPASEWLFQRILSLPIYPSMSGADVDQVIRAVREITSKFGK